MLTTAGSGPGWTKSQGPLNYCRSASSPCQVWSKILDITDDLLVFKSLFLLLFPGTKLSASSFVLQIIHVIILFWLPNLFIYLIIRAFHDSALGALPFSCKMLFLDLLILSSAFASIIL